jgi:hypothetical protein
MFNLKEFSKGLVNFLFRKFEMLSIKIFEKQNFNLGMINDIPDHVFYGFPYFEGHSLEGGSLSLGLHKEAFTVI